MNYKLFFKAYMRYLVFFFLTTLVFSCNYKKVNDPIIYDTPKKTIIKGQIENINPAVTNLTFYVSRIGVSRDVIEVAVDSLGRFEAQFESYIPTDVLLQYKRNIFMLTHPGDVIELNFDGSTKETLENSLTYTANRKESNQDIFSYQIQNDLIRDKHRAKNSLATKNLEPVDYLTFLDSLSQNHMSQLENYASSKKMTAEAKSWAKMMVKDDARHYLTSYKRARAQALGVNSYSLKLPLNFYDRLNEELPIKPENLIAGYALANLINQYNHYYLWNVVLNQKENKKYIYPNGNFAVPKATYDSIKVYNAIINTPDNMMMQLALTETFTQELEQSRIHLIEKYKELADTTITEPFLREPLRKKYLEVKNFIDNPKQNSKALFKDVSNVPGGELIDQILSKNQGKLIYVDFWATWCGPCLTEMPHSKKLMEQLTSEEIVFIYIAIDSEEKTWQAKLSELQLSGQQYFLDPQQSQQIRRALDIQGIPYYMLIDKEGTILEKGSSFRPSIAREKIEQLLEN